VSSVNELPPRKYKAGDLVYVSKRGDIGLNVSGPAVIEKPIANCWESTHPGHWYQIQMFGQPDWDSRWNAQECDFAEQGTEIT